MDKKKPSRYTACKNSFHLSRHAQIESEELEKDTLSRWNLKTAGLGILFLKVGKVDFKSKLMKTDKKGHYKVIKRLTRKRK